MKRCCVLNSQNEKDSILQVLLFLIMLGMGMTLTVSDFKRVALYPKAAVIGLSNQLVLLPIIGFLIATALPIDPLFAVGLMVVVACPGGATSNLMSHLSKGDTALSISMTAVSSVITILTIPFIINFALGYFLDQDGVSFQLPIGATVVNILKLTAAPVILGMLINYYLPKFTAWARKPVAIGSVIMILLALGVMVLKLDEIGDVWGFIKAVFWSVLILNLVTLFIGYASSKLFNLNTPQSATISLESSMQNNVLGMAIATSTTMLNEPLMAVPAGVYGIVMCTTGALLIFLFRRMIS